MSTTPPAAPALAAPQPEPVAWLKTMYSGNRPMLEVDHSKPPKADSMPVYAAPPAPATSADYAMGYAEGFNDACKPAPAVPLTDEQINDIWNAKDLPEHRSHLTPWGMDRIRAIIAAASGIEGGGK